MRCALGTVRCFRRFISHLCYSPSSFVALINCKRLMLPDQKASREVGEAELLSTVAVSKEPGTHRLTPKGCIADFLECLSPSMLANVHESIHLCSSNSLSQLLGLLVTNWNEDA